MDFVIRRFMITSQVRMHAQMQLRRNKRYDILPLSRSRVFDQDQSAPIWTVLFRAMTAIPERPRESHLVKPATQQIRLPPQTQKS
jgi:hypothetical protein